MAAKPQSADGATWNKLRTLLLRMLPVLPGPEIYDLLVEFRKERTGLGEKVHRTATALQEATELVEELRDELQSKLTDVAKLQTEYDRYQKLAEVEENKARALIDQLQVTLSKGRGRERWISLGLNLLAGLIVFAFGVVSSGWISDILGLD